MASELSQSELERIAEDLQSSISLEQGPMFRAALFHLPDGDLTQIVVLQTAQQPVDFPEHLLPRRTRKS